MLEEDRPSSCLRFTMRIQYWVDFSEKKYALLHEPCALAHTLCTIHQKHVKSTELWTQGLKPRLPCTVFLPSTSRALQFALPPSLQELQKQCCPAYVTVSMCAGFTGIVIPLCYTQTIGGLSMLTVNPCRYLNIIP